MLLTITDKCVELIIRSGRKNCVSDHLKKLWVYVAIIAGYFLLVIGYNNPWIDDHPPAASLMAGSGFAITIIALFYVGFNTQTAKSSTIKPIGEIITEKMPLFALRDRRSAKIVLILIVPLAIVVIFMHESASSYYQRGTSHLSLSEYQLAIQDFDRAIELDPNYEGAFYNRGKAYYHLGEYQCAIQDFTRVIELDPQHIFTYNKRGKCYQALGMTAEAEADFARYKELTGKDQP
jgi:tetratricopeptide (TPR) repeat protein